MTKAVGSLGVVEIACTSTGAAVELVKTMGRTHPKIVVAVLVNASDQIAAQAPWNTGIVPVVSGSPGSGIEAVQPSIRPNPQRAVAVLVNTFDLIADQAIRDVRLMPVVREDTRSRVPAFQAIENRSDPEDSAPIFINGKQVVAANTIGVGGIVAVRRQGIAVVAKEAVVRGKPHEALVVLGDATDVFFKCLTARGEGDEADILFVDYGK